MCELLIFGGTTEGRELAEYCVEVGVPTAVSVATEYGGGLLPNSERLHIMVGRLDSEHMKMLMRDIGCRAVIDATHPYATEVTENIKAACNAADIPYHRLLRASEDLTGCSVYPSMHELVERLNSGNETVLSTLGSKEFAKLTEVRGYAERIWCRALPTAEIRRQCREYGFAEDQMILEKGPFSVEQNIAHIRMSGAKLIVTKESGTAGGFPEKIEAARQCGIEALVLARPSEVGNTMDEIKNIILKMRR
ncbi:MAG: precorrin-6A reductase [Ruminococcus sp.]|uniref:precorrin-6A reductase n=1 Tax=Ruminococcus sp. TaxID=41978 RepID=UPI001568E8CB|nr:precorrin-6A reductase [Ruminococcus sp.]MCR5600910.1 precorrin-6A reductase [Ruminococcus sp.]